MGDTKNTPDYPLVDTERKQQIKIDARTPKATVPKKKLTPRLLDAIARVRGTKRRIYKADLSLEELVKELQSINKQLKLLKSGQGNREEIEAKLADIVDMMGSIEAEPLVIHKIQSSVQSKLKALKSKVDEDVLAMEKTTLTVRKAGDPQYCKDCEHAPCACFLHLPKPRLIKTEDGPIKIEFDAEWNTFDRQNYLKAMKYILAKKK